MKIYPRLVLVALAAGLLAGCGESITGVGAAAEDDSSTPAVANHVDNPGQTPMGP
jgi:hypothetical protein